MPKKVILFFLVLFLTACSQGFKSETIESSNDSKLDSPGDDSNLHPPPFHNGPPPVIISPAPSFCSELDVTGVTWPSELGLNGRDYLGLALNITGSFEGRNGWANLSNNFDGMGFSLGLLQQNLGTGSLQPILNEVIAMQKNGESFGIDTNHFQAIQIMMNQWNKNKARVSTSSLLTSFARPNGFYSDQDRVSIYDKAPTVQQEALEINDLTAMASENKGITTTNLNAVSWALSTVYLDRGDTFKTSWSQNLTRMAESKPYIGLQLKYAMKIYSLSFYYFKAFRLTSLSHYLLMFDFVVQNGGFKKSLLDQFLLKLKQKPNMSAQEKALLILDLRIKDVLPRWQSDVISRKKTIIFSEGTVHGAKRNLKSEYCYTPDSLVLTQP